MKILLIIYCLLLGVVFFIFIKYGYDYYVLSVKDNNENIEIVNNKVITRPRLQLNNSSNGFTYIIATDGILLNNSDYEFNNIVMTDKNYGYGSANKLFIRDNKNILEFKGNVNFKINEKVAKQ